MTAKAIKGVRRDSQCSTCGTWLLQPGGFHATGLCGPCCTGEAETIATLTNPRCERCGVGFEYEKGGNAHVCYECIIARRRKS